MQRYDLRGMGQPAQGQDRKQQYKLEYEAAKAGGKPFFPFIVFKDSIAALVAMIVVFALAYFVGAPLDAPADPTNTSYAPRPDWYFLFFFEGLKYFPGSLEWLAALVLPALGVGVLVMLPFLDRGRRRHPWNRKLVVGTGAVVFAGIVGLSIVGANAPVVVGVPSGEELGRLLPIERAGRQIFRQRACLTCHAIGGAGGKIGPDLTLVGRRLDAAALVKHLRQPPPGMPAMTFSDVELLELSAYLLTLKKAPVGNIAIEAGKATFNQTCGGCHPGGKAGVGPAISGSDFNRRYPNDANIERLVRSGRGGMPSFDEKTLPPEKLAEIIAYLRSLK